MARNRELTFAQYLERLLFSWDVEQGSKQLGYPITMEIPNHLRPLMPDIVQALRPDKSAQGEAPSLPPPAGI